jgi:DNA repair exonuclease SbcCD ATPase subunit
MEDLLSLKSAKDKLNVLKTAFNLSIYDKLLKKASELSTDNNKSLFAENKVLESIGGPDEELLINNQKLDDTIKILKSKNQELEHLKSKLLEKNSALSDLHSSTQEDEIGSKINAIKSEINLLKSKIEKCSNEITTNEKRISEGIQKKNLTISKKQNLEVQLEELSKVKLLDKQSLLTDGKSLDDDILKFQKEISVLEFNLNKLNHPMTSEEICPECFQEVPSSYRQQYEIKTNEEIKALNDKLLSIKDNLKKSSVKKEKHNLLIFEQDQTKSKLSKINSDLLNIDELIESFDKNVEQLSSSIASLQQDIFNLQNLLIDKQSNLEILEEKQLNDPNLSSDNKTKILEIKAEIVQLNNSIDAFNKSISQGETNKIILTEKISNNKVSIEKKNDSLLKLKAFDDLKNQLQILQQGFGPLGAPNLVITSILDEFQKNTNYWLSKIRNGLEVQFNISKLKAGVEEDTFNMNFFYNGREFDLSQLSGGQKFIIKISLKLGLIDTLKNKFNIKLNLLCFDEVDEHIDISASKAFFEIIKELEKEYKILIITHKELLKEKFNNYVVVKCDGKSSYAELKK